MILHEKQRGSAILIGVVLIGICFLGGTAHLVYRTGYVPTNKSLNSPLPQNTGPTKPDNSQVGMDYPAPQGIKGQVLCNDKVDPVPCHTKLEIQIQSSDPSMGNGPVKIIETDAEGKFEYDTAPGHYTITPAPKDGFTTFVPPLVNPVIVYDRQMTEITITYHSGLR